MASSSSRKVVLKSSDEEIFEIDESVALQSETVKHLIDEGCYGDTPVPILNVNGKTLAMVIEYLNRMPLNPDEPEKKEFKTWKAEFIKVDRLTLFNLILAANYMDIKSLLDLGCQAAADMIKDMQPEEVRSIFNIECDLTPEEEAEIRRNNAWSFQ